MSRICLYYRKPQEEDRWLPGDRHVRPLVRRLVRGRPRPGGVEKVFQNLCRGLDRLGLAYSVNLPFARLEPDDRVGVLGVGRHALAGYDRSNPIVAGIGLMTHPNEWPTLCEEHPVAFYLQHSDWANDVYRPYFREKCRIWPAGIDTDAWQPAPGSDKGFNFLIYDKLRRRRQEMVPHILDPIREELTRRRLTFTQLTYGQYDEHGYRQALARSRAMIFLSEHESQGLAYQECLASGVPVLAWDQGLCLDPSYFTAGSASTPATSVPYFDDRCGERFSGVEQFATKLDVFLDRFASGEFRPRDYVLGRLTLERCAQDFVAILDDAQKIRMTDGPRPMAEPVKRAVPETHGRTNRA